MNGIIQGIGIGIVPALQPDRIGLDVAPGARIVVAVAVVVEVGERAHLPGEPGKRDRRRRHRRTRIRRVEQRHAEVAAVHPLDRSARQRHRERRVAIRAVPAAVDVVVRRLRQQPDRLRHHVVRRTAILAQRPLSNISYTL